MIGHAFPQSVNAGSALSSPAALAARTQQRALRTGMARSAGIMAVAGAALFTVLIFAGCRTTEGAGRDLEHLGDNIADSADKNKP